MNIKVNETKLWVHSYSVSTIRGFIKSQQHGKIWGKSGDITPVPSKMIDV